MSVLALDTATAATAVAVLRSDGIAFEGRHEPAPGERPGHATQVLGLVEEAMAAARVTPEQLRLVAVGTGPGSFTGLRIGVSTARALAQGWGVPVAGCSTLRALAAGAGEDDAAVLAVLDARRGEAFAAAWAGDTCLLAPAALSPEALARAVARLPVDALAVGDGAVRFRAQLEPAGASIPPDGDPLHRVSARHHCRLVIAAEGAGRDPVLPEYLRLPDAEIARRHRT